MSWKLYMQQSKTSFEKMKLGPLKYKNIYIYHIYIHFEFLPFYVLYLQVNHYAKFSLAHKLISFLQVSWLLYSASQYWKTTAGENWHIVEKHRGYQIF